MRQYKFRAWDSELNKMVYDDHDAKHDCDDWGGVHGSVIGLLNRLFKYHHHYTIEQFTGLLDKNGKEIYCGDIVKYSRTKGNRREFENGELIHIGEIVWSEKMCAFCFNYNFSSGGGYTTHGLSFDDQRFYKHETEVIGNIHESPELLK